MDCVESYVNGGGFSKTKKGSACRTAIFVRTRPPVPGLM